MLSIVSTHTELGDKKKHQKYCRDINLIPDFKNGDTGNNINVSHRIQRTYY